MVGKVYAPIFIVGAPRSGTTLTARILGRHSRIFMPGEVHFFDDIYSRWKELGNPTDHPSIVKIIERLSTLYGRYNEPQDQKRIDRLFGNTEVLNKLESSCKNYRDIFTFFMEIQMVHEGKVRWGNNTPRDIFNIEKILSFYPDAKILICVRDVRDFLISYKNKWRVTSVDNIERLKRLYHPIITSMLWKSSIRVISIIKSQVSKQNLMIVQYEELVQNSEEVVHKICKFLGEKFEHEMIEVNSNNSSAEVKGDGIFSTSVGRWRKSLSKEEAYVAQWITRKELDSLGYSIEKIHVNLLKFVWVIASFPFALLRGLYASREHRGSLIPYLALRVASFLYRA